MCKYEPVDTDIRDPGRDWITVQPAEQPCEDCVQAVKLAS
jgi:hypothetical protein